MWFDGSARYQLPTRPRSRLGDQPVAVGTRGGDGAAFAAGLGDRSLQIELRDREARFVGRMRNTKIEPRYVLLAAEVEIGVRDDDRVLTPVSRCGHGEAARGERRDHDDVLDGMCLRTQAVTRVRTG